MARPCEGLIHEFHACPLLAGERRWNTRPSRDRFQLMAAHGSGTSGFRPAPDGLASTSGLR